MWHIYEVTKSRVSVSGDAELGRKLTACPASLRLRAGWWFMSWASFLGMNVTNSGLDVSGSWNSSSEEGLKDGEMLSRVSHSATLSVIE